MTRHPIGLSVLVSRLRWLMVAVMLFDLTITLLGQPSVFWRDPSFVREGNFVFRWLMLRGPWVFLPAGAGYICVMFVLATFLPAPLGFGIIVFNVVVHFAGGTSWLTHHFALPSVLIDLGCGGLLAAVAAAMAHRRSTGKVAHP